MRDEYRTGMTLDEYARAWLDMHPHIGDLQTLAGDAKVVVEFGVRGAVSTWAMLETLPQDGQIISVDIDPDCPIPPPVREDPRFTFIAGNDLEVTLPAVADLVVIDSSHEYQQTLDELEVAALMGPDVIALHDYLYPETPAVRQAVDEFVAGQEDYRLVTVHPSYWGLAILRRS